MKRRNFFTVIASALGFDWVFPEKSKANNSLNDPRPGVVVNSKLVYRRFYDKGVPEEKDQPEEWFVEVEFDNGRKYLSRYKPKCNIAPIVCRRLNAYDVDLPVDILSTEYEISEYYGVMYTHSEFCNHNKCIKDLGFCPVCETTKPL